MLCRQALLKSACDRTFQPVTGHFRDRLFLVAVLQRGMWVPVPIDVERPVRWWTSHQEWLLSTKAYRAKIQKQGRPTCPNDCPWTLIKGSATVGFINPIFTFRHKTYLVIFWKCLLMLDFNLTSQAPGWRSPVRCHPPTTLPFWKVHHATSPVQVIWSWCRQLAGELKPCASLPDAEGYLVRVTCLWQNVNLMIWIWQQAGSAKLINPNMLTCSRGSGSRGGHLLVQVSLGKALNSSLIPTLAPNLDDSTLQPMYECV